jgi:hypothetical protein
MLWTIWLSQNDIVFNKSPTFSYMQADAPIGQEHVHYSKRRRIEVYCYVHA